MSARAGWQNICQSTFRNSPPSSPRTCPRRRASSPPTTVYTQAPRDDTVIGTFSRNFPISALLGGHGIEADPRRFLWLGATSFPGRICAVWHTMPIKTPQDLLTRDLIVGGTGAGSSLAILPKRRRGSFMDALQSSLPAE